MPRNAKPRGAVSLDPEPIHSWFELSYANYLVLPRSILQSAPEEWQRRLVALLDELGELFEGVEFDPPGGYRVIALDAGGRFILHEFRDYERGRRRVPLREGRRHG